MKVTPWFSGDVEPVHVGVYERKYGYGYSYWTGRVWCAGSGSARSAAADPLFESLHQNIAWRGLASDPKAKTCSAMSQP